MSDDQSRAADVLREIERLIGRAVRHRLDQAGQVSPEERIEAAKARTVEVLEQLGYTSAPLFRLDGAGQLHVEIMLCSRCLCPLEMGDHSDCYETCVEVSGEITLEGDT